MPKEKSGESRGRRRDAPYKEKESFRRSGDRRNHDDDHQRRRRRRHEEDDTLPCATFDDMKLKPDLLKGIYAYGFEKPSAIQQRAIRPIFRGRDVIAQSQSGTGKTAVFSIASLQLIDETSRDTQVLVLSPTRELAEQSQRVLQSLGDFMNVSLRMIHSVITFVWAFSSQSRYLFLILKFFRSIVMRVLEGNLWGAT